MSNFWTRALTGTVFVITLVAAIYFGGWYLHLLFGLITLLALQEFYKLFSKSQSNPDQISGPILGTLLYFFAVYDIRFSELPLKGEESSGHSHLFAFSLFIFILLALLELFRKKKTPFENIGIGIVGMIYIVLPFVLVNNLAWSTDKDIATNIWPLMAIFIIVWCNDTFAYLIGRQIGKHKLFERISPKKSWEGFFGGFLFAILAGILIAWLTEQSFLQYGIYGAVISVFGTLGDLVESMLKRSVHIKDSGKILPGHGGILDRFDAVLFVIPVIYFLHNYIFTI